MQKMIWLECINLVQIPSIFDTNLHSPPKDNFQPLGSVGQYGRVGSNVSVPEELGPELIGHVGDGLGGVSGEGQQGIQVGG